MYMLKDRVVSVVSENCHITVYLHTVFCKHSDSPDIGVSQDTYVSGVLTLWCQL